MIMRFAIDRMEYLRPDRHLYGTVTTIGEPTRVIAKLPVDRQDAVAARGPAHDSPSMATAPRSSTPRPGCDVTAGPIGAADDA